MWGRNVPLTFIFGGFMQEYKVLKIFKSEDGVWRKPAQVVKLSDKEGLKQRQLGHAMRINQKPKKKSGKTETYIATGNIRYNKVDYGYGNKMDLSKEEAQPLLEGNAIETPKGFKVLEEIKNASPATIQTLQADVKRLEADLKAANDTIAVLQSQKQEKPKDETDKK
jgi:hypothetical protein